MADKVACKLQGLSRPRGGARGEISEDNVAARPEGLSDNEWRGVAPRYIVVGTVPRDWLRRYRTPLSRGVLCPETSTKGIGNTPLQVSHPTPTQPKQHLVVRPGGVEEGHREEVGGVGLLAPLLLPHTQTNDNPGN